MFANVVSCDIFKFERITLGSVDMGHLTKRIGRRHVIVGGLTLFGSLATRRLRAQGTIDVASMRRGAVVVGIDSYPHLPHLRAAVSGAVNMANFLRAEGFDTRLFIDRDDPVRGSDLFDAVAGFVDDTAGLDQLVVYFSGHGFLSGTTEIWMLSNAPYDTAEAVSVLESAELAYQSNIPNVVLISDACRSLASDLGTSQVTGRKIFPAGRTPDRRTDVDIFFGTRPGDSSYELPVRESVQQHEGIYTSAFLKAFSHPTGDMIYRFDNGVTVIPNRKMRDFLFHEVSERAQDFAINLTQYPDSRITSDIPTFVGHIQESAGSVGPPQSWPDPSDIAVPNAVQKVVQDAALTGSVAAQPTSGSPIANELFQVLARAINLQRADVVLEDTGFAVYGAKVAQAGAWGIELRREFGFPGADAWRVFVPDDIQGAYVAVYFEDGRGTIVPLIRGFGTHVAVGEKGITDIRFNATRNSEFFSDYQGQLGQRTALRGLAAAATRQGALVFEGSREEREMAAHSFADRARIGNGLDPTLGIYAAYAYAAGFMEDGVRSVHDIMLGTLGVELFDIALLAGVLDEDARSLSGAQVVPPVPLMRQGWEYLRVRGVKTTRIMAAARPALVDSLWTMYDGEAAKLVTDLVAGTPPGDIPQ